MRVVLGRAEPGSGTARIGGSVYAVQDHTLGTGKGRLDQG